MTRLRFSAFNLALAYIALSIAVLAAFATPLWYTWRENFEERRAFLLGEEARSFTEVFEKSGVTGLARVIDARLAGARGSDDIILLANHSHVPLAGNLTAWPPEVPQAVGTYTLSFRDQGRTLNVLLVHTFLPDGYELLTGRENSRFRSLEMLFWWGLAGAAGFVLLLGIGGGFLIRRLLLSEVQEISQTANAIVNGNLSRRVPTQNRGDELDVLAQTVNRMLDQIEHLIQGVRNVSNAIAHDLRTPLAELRSRLEELMVTRRSPEEAAAEIETAVADTDRVIAMFDALLRLAEIDSGARRSGFVQADLAKVASEVAEFYQPAAELKGLTLCVDTSGALTVACDPLLLSQAIANLIDNALKYAQNGKIRVAATRRPDDMVEISVTDDGPGISDRDKPKVVERFYRGDASRGTPGVGLGLALVATVAKLHGGTLELADNHPGLRASLLFAAT